jgi:hypothetical protein
VQLVVVARHSQHARLVYVVQVKCLVLVMGLAACDLSQKTAADRPEQFDYIVEAILAPSCGTSECHSAMRQQSGDVFDSVAGARASLDAHRDLVVSCATIPSGAEAFPCGRDAANNSYLFTVLEKGPGLGVTNPIGQGDVMPLDQALPSADKELIGQWIVDGAEGYDIKPIGTP